MHCVVYSAIFTDGSGECQIYFDSDTAQGIMKCEETKWSQLMEFVEKYRSVKYYRVQQAQVHNSNYHEFNIIIIDELFMHAYNQFFFHNYIPLESWRGIIM